ncbi:MAG: FAD-dependent oxidoreductase [bacterium]|nr:FAD-dependent oxidoreductase [bacterium]
MVVINKNIVYTLSIMETIKQSPNSETVAIVGTGISGLMEALFLHQAGFVVSVYGKGPDPRTNQKAEHFSSTHNGELGRFISRFEGEHYLGDSAMYPDMAGAFERHVLGGGWLGKNELDDFDKTWIKKRLQACEDKKSMDDTERFYVQANGEAMSSWQKIILDFPELFYNADLLNTGILRLYDNENLFRWAAERHGKEAVLERALTPVEVATDYPYFAEACTLGYVTGAVEAPGFSFNVHKFCQNLINYLAKEGIIFYWEREILRIQFTKDHLVQGLVTANGLIIADNYCLNPGAYANEELLVGTEAEGKIAGVAGRWLFLPSPKNFKRPVKIHGDVRVVNGRRYPVVDVNLTHFADASGKEWLAVGGGYAYLGKPPFDLDNAALRAIDEENERTVKMYLGPIYQEAEKDGLIKKSSATCVRSFTYNDMPVMANMPTTSGGILRINAGTNTGTTTIAPFMAGETVRALLGRVLKHN